MCLYWHPYIYRVMHQNITGSTVSHCILVHKPPNSGIWICPVDQLSFKYVSAVLLLRPSGMPISWDSNHKEKNTNSSLFLNCSLKACFWYVALHFFKQKLTIMMFSDNICKNVYVINTNSGDFLRATTTTLYIYGYIHRSKHPHCSSAK